jgi:hypothetical protein
MQKPADAYRLRAADMLDLAEEYDFFREEFENLARGFLRLAEHAEHSTQLVRPPRQDDQQLQGEKTVSQEGDRRSYARKNSQMFA